MHNHLFVGTVLNPTRARSWMFRAIALTVTLFVASVANAQIKRPGAHLHYDVELEPQGVIQWDGPSGFDEGFGFGFRAAIPLFHNGPIPKINNNMAIGFGFHWAFFDDPCTSRYFYDVRVFGPDCSANDLWFPVVAQWNFYLTPSIAVFGEPGFAIRHTRVSVDSCPAGIDCDYSDTEFEPLVIYFGAKFFVSDTVSVTVRLGYPTLSVGASFFL